MSSNGELILAGALGTAIVLREIPSLVMKLRGSISSTGNGNGNGNGASSRESMRAIVQEILAPPIEKMADSQSRMETAMIEFIAYQKGKDQARAHASGRG